MRSVPANCSRYFDLKHDAENQPIGMIDLDLDKSEMFVFNKSYNESFIMHDQHYCTVNEFQFTESAENFEKTVLVQPIKSVVDIGCGQGEFVKHLRSKDILAVGYDPVLRTKSEYLFKKYFRPSEEKIISNSVYTMRCILPHIKNPFHFLEEIFYYDRRAKIYIEYQNLEWIVHNKMWTQISHDHVNYFSIDSFDSQFNVIQKGIFGNGEWSYVLIDMNLHGKQFRPPSNLNKLIELENDVSKLIENQLKKPY